jgi:hypothetical protein
MCVLRHSSEVDIFEYLKFNRATLRRDNARAGFDSATVFSPLKELSSLNKSSAPLSSEGTDHTTESGLLLCI